MFDRPRFRTARLEDAEEVVRIRGGQPSRSGFPSDQPHAGMWGPETAYVLVPSPGSSARRRARALLEFCPALRDRSGDAEVLVTGSPEDIRRVLESGPMFARARLRNGPQDASRLMATRYVAAETAQKEPNGP